MLKVGFDSIILHLADYVRNHRDPYLLFRFLQKFSTQDYYEMVRGYYECSSDMSTLIAKHYGDDYPNEIVYFIPFGVEGHRGGTGFFGTMRWLLGLLSYADHFGFIPVVKWGEGIPYYDHDMDHITTNAFEYYFEPVSHIPSERVFHCRNVVVGRNMHANFFLPYGDAVHSYLLDDNEIEVLAGLYRKYIHLNESTSEYINSEIAALLNNKKTLGIHARGTDFNMSFHNHPVPVSPASYLDAARKEFSNGEYEQLFLATEDQNILDLFIRSFGDDLIYFGDIIRSSDTVSPHTKENSRPNNHYLLGREVLRDAYTLAACDSLIAGLSQVSFAARYINVAEGRSYKVLTIINNGVNSAVSGRMSRRTKHPGGLIYYSVVHYSINSPCFKMEVSV